MSLTQGFLDELKARISIVEVIGKHVRLIRRGHQYQGLCPFHGERTPSFHVWDDHYHCFGCGAHGSVIDFVMQADKIGFREAVERIAMLAGMSRRRRRRRSRLPTGDAARWSTRWRRRPATSAGCCGCRRARRRSTICAGAALPTRRSAAGGSATRPTAATP